jgi:inhibitor of KinA sporulation pathway (predicted exonuclease)
MGGLLVKKVISICTPKVLTCQAIINAYNDRLYTNIVKNTKAIIFLGTPHRGADLANNLSKLLSISLSRKIFVDQLRPESEMIEEMNNAFRHRSESLELISYFESAGIHPTGVSPTY